MKRVVMNRAGRLTVPAEARRELGLDGETEFEVEVDRVHAAIILRPTVAPRDEDGWACTPAHRDLLAQAHQESREGRVRRVTEEDLARPGGLDD